MENIKLENNVFKKRLMVSLYTGRQDNCSKIRWSYYRLTFRKTILFYGLIFLIINSTSAIPPKESYQTLAQDSAKITVRKPLESKMNALIKSKDYQYGVQESQVLDTWWRRLLRRFFNWFGNLFTGVGNPTFWKIAAYVFMGIGLVALLVGGID